MIGKSINWSWLYGEFLRINACDSIYLVPPHYVLPVAILEPNVLPIYPSVRRALTPQLTVFISCADLASFEVFHFTFFPNFVSRIKRHERSFNTTELTQKVSRACKWERVADERQNSLQM